jgi:hypothetical protein
MRLVTVTLGLSILIGPTACKESSPAAPPPCEGTSPPALCDTACTRDASCGDDLYCSLDLVCTGDCTADGDQCGPDAACVDHGRCVPRVPDGGAGDAGDALPFPDAQPCGTVRVSLQPVIPTVVILIDQSGSMTEDFGGVERWDALRTALVDEPDGVVTQLAPQVIFGATLYTSNGGSAGGTCPLLTAVDPTIDNAGPIRDLLDDNGPSGDTPTGESVAEVAQALAALPENPEYPHSPKVIVLATDGEPDTCAEPNPQNGQEESVAAVQAAHAMDVRTFVLSVGDDVGAAHLQDVANAGAGLPVDGPTLAPFYVANSQQELVEAFLTIINGTRSCDLTVAGRVLLDQASQAVVILNGETLVYGTGWEMTGESSMALLGEACDTFLSAETVVLTADFPCGSIVQ